MEVTILTGNRVRSIYGIVYEIYALEIKKESRNGDKVLYFPDTKIFKCVAVPGTKSNAYIMSNNKVMLL